MPGCGGGGLQMNSLDKGLQRVGTGPGEAQIEAQQPPSPSRVCKVRGEPLAQW